MKLILGDCLEKMRDLPTATIDAVICDPPYGTTACKWDSVIPFEPMWKELKRVTKPNAAICLFGQNPFTANLIMSNPRSYRYDWVWKKSRPAGHLNSKKQPLRATEFVSVFYEQQSQYFPQGLVAGVFDNDRPWKRKYKRAPDSVYGNQKPQKLSLATNYPKNLLEFANPNNRAFHPTQKPTDLLAYLIRTYTEPGDIVLDFTMGSGSTGVACVNTGRLFIGIEKDERYFEIAQKRIDDAQAAREQAQLPLPEVPA